MPQLLARLLKISRLLLILYYSPLSVTHTTPSKVVADIPTPLPLDCRQKATCALELAVAGPTVATYGTFHSLGFPPPRGTSYRTLKGCTVPCESMKTDPLGTLQATKHSYSLSVINTAGCRLPPSMHRH